MEKSKKYSEIFNALIQFQGEIEAIVKETSNPYFKSVYADLPSIIGAVRPVLAKYNMAYVQSLISDRNPITGEPSGKIIIETVLIHKSGEWMSSTLPLDVGTKPGPQVYGSAITYARRYGLQTTLGLATEDDDANAAQGPPAEKKKTTFQRSRTPAKSTTPSKPKSNTRDDKINAIKKRQRSEPAFDKLMDQYIKSCNDNSDNTIKHITDMNDKMVDTAFEASKSDVAMATK